VRLFTHRGPRSCAPLGGAYAALGTDRSPNLPTPAVQPGDRPPGDPIGTRRSRSSWRAGPSPSRGRGGHT